MLPKKVDWKPPLWSKEKVLATRLVG